MDEDHESLRLLLKRRCSGAKFRDDDIKKLVDAGYDTETALASASKEALGLVLPTRPGVVGVLAKAFVQPAEGFAHSKRSRIEDGVPSNIQAFAESAAKYYTDWEEAGKAGVENGGHKNFLVVRSDPFGNFPVGLLVWIRQCYLDLKDILATAKESERFVLLGTAGIGKSLFTLFWICYRATLKEKVVWKLADSEWYLLDFSEEGSLSAKRVEQSDSEMLLVLSDPNAWLIIDGRQPGNLVYKCHILLACSL